MRTDFYNYFPSIYHSNSLLYLQVGFKTMGYEERVQKPAYDITSLLGKFFINKMSALSHSLIAILGRSRPLLLSILTARVIHPATSRNVIHTARAL